MKTAKEHLEKFGIRPSVQRVAVMDYLLKHRTHPTVDEIYQALAPQIPTLSRTTVYNTLHLLYKHGAILVVVIDGITAHFDGYTHPHAHFLCTECGKVYDVELKDPSFIEHNAPENAAEIRDAQLYYKGICKECADKKN
ncbi:MAG: transcriptional repressor [Tidjanibacter sp.]|nr:transcriptional repressor [Tidjanibacter sp.]